MIFYLNGTSSSGKTTIAKALQNKIEKPIFYFSIDTLLYSLSEKDLESVMGKRAYDYKLDWSSVFEGYLSSVSAIHKSGNNVIADLPIYTENLYKVFQKYINPIKNKQIIKIFCPLEVLNCREEKRGDRSLGLAEKQHPTIHKFLDYDLTINSNTDNLDLEVQKIIKPYIQM